MTKLMSKSELIQKVADQHSLSKKDVKGVIESLASVGYKELKKNGAFLLPGFAKFVVIRKPWSQPNPASRRQDITLRAVAIISSLSSAEGGNFSNWRKCTLAKRSGGSM